MLEAVRAVRAVAGSTAPVVAGNVVTADGHPRPDRGRRRHRQGRRRAGRDVHDADDDRRRPAAVLRGRWSARRGRARARQARLGRRRRALPARRRAGPGRRRGERDGRLVVRRHLRERRRHCTTTRRPALQGELRHGVGTARSRTGRRPSRASSGPAKELFEEGISTSRMYLDPERPGVEDMIDQIVAGVRSALHLRRRARRSPSCTSARSSGVQSAAGYEEGRPLPTSW